MKRARVVYEDVVSSPKACPEGVYTIIPTDHGELKIACCESSKVCRRKQIERLAKLAQEKAIRVTELRNERVLLREEIKDLKMKNLETEKELAAANTRIEVLEKVEQSKTTTTVNNYHYTDNRQVNVINNAIGDQAMGILQDGLQNKNIFLSAFERLQGSPDHPERTRMLEMAKSSDPVERLKFKKEVVDSLKEKLPGIPQDNQTLGLVEEGLKKMDELIKNDARHLGLEEVD